VDPGNRNIYAVLKEFYPARLVSIMKVWDIKTCFVDRHLLLDRINLENSGKLYDISRLVTDTLSTAKGPTGTTEIVVGFKSIMEMAHLLSKREVNNTLFSLNNWIDLETCKRIY